LPLFRRKYDIYYSYFPKNIKEFYYITAKKVFFATDKELILLNFINRKYNDLEKP